MDSPTREVLGSSNTPGKRGTYGSSKLQSTVASSTAPPPQAAADELFPFPQLMEQMRAAAPSPT
jgi:hypothetical protein